jgi:hypothetical protein
MRIPWRLLLTWAALLLVVLLVAWALFILFLRAVS